MIGNSKDERDLLVRLREYGGEVLHARDDDYDEDEEDPAFSNEVECALAALDAADEIERLRTLSS